MTTESYTTAEGLSSRGDPLPPDPAEAICPACGSPLQRRGQQKGLEVYACADRSCPMTLVELLEHGTPRRRGG